MASALLAVFVLASSASVGGGAPLGPPSGGQCFTADTIRTHYGPDADTNARTAGQCKAYGDGLWLDDWLDPMPEGDMRSIAEACKKDYPNDTYRQVHCAATMVNDYVDSHFHYDSNSSNGFRTYCRDHERAFRQVMDMIGNPKVSVSDTCIAISGPNDHILNTVTITGDDGKKYSYALDTGWYPDELDPMPGTAACDYFQQHGGPGGDQNTLPPVDGVTANVGPSSPAASGVGNNVARTARTSATPESASTGDNAGFHH